MQSSTDQSLQLAVQHHKAGRLREAEVLYRQVLSRQPDHVDALLMLARLYHQAGHPSPAADLLLTVTKLRPGSASVLANLGLMLSMAARPDAAIAAFRQSLSLDPANADVQNSLGTLLQQKGELEAAVAAYRQAISIRPNYPEAFYNLGSIHSALSEWDQAVAAYRQAVRLRPNYAEAFNNLGHTLQQIGTLDEAAAAYRQAIALRPDYPEAHSNLGSLLRVTGDLDAAIAACQRAVTLRPTYADAYSNLGAALSDRGLHEQAAEAFRKTLSLKPDSPATHFNLANAMRTQGRLDEAVAEYRRALELRPSFPEALNNLGLVYREQGRIDESIATFNQALSLRSNYPDARNNLGSALKDAGDLDGAMTQYRAALEADPKSADVLNNLGIALKDAGRLEEARDYHDRAQQTKLDPQIAGNLASMLHFHPDYDMRQIYEAHARWNETFVRPLHKLIRPHENDRSPDRRLRIGYVSPDFRGHVVGRNMLPLFREHDHRQFEIICYSNVVRRDAITERFKSMSDGWREIQHLNDDQASNLIRRDRIDILVDLALHMAGGRLMVFARKPAPVQVTFAGYPGTTGAETIDYRLTDPYLDPPGMFDEYHAEKSVRLPHSFWCYEPENGIAVNPLPAIGNGFVMFGCLNNFCKVTDPTLRLWTRVLRAVPNSRLLLLSRPGQHRQRVSDLLASEEVDPERLEFVDLQPREHYLRTYHRIDIALDTFPYNGHTTSLDAYWMGVPVVTKIGSTVAGRAGWSQLNNLGLTDLAANDSEQFVQIATELARDLPRLAHLRSTLRDRMLNSPLTDARGFARGIEAAYRQMWTTWCSHPLPAPDVRG